MHEKEELNLMTYRETHRADHLRWREVEAYLKEDDRVLLPIGAVEQHALHLAMGTDTITADAVCRDAAERVGIISYPPIWYGWSEGHLAFPGTASLKPHTLISMIVDIVESLSLGGFKRFIIVSGHRRGNLPPLQIAASQLSSGGERMVAVADLGYLALEETLRLRKSQLGGLGHADELETSHMLYLAPELVDMAAGAEKPAHVPDLLQQFMPSDPALEMRSRFYLPKALALTRPTPEATGLGGDASCSTAEAGAALHEAFVAGLIRVIDTVTKHKLPLEKNAP